MSFPVWTIVFHFFYDKLGKYDTAEMSPKKTGEISTFTLNTGVVILRFKPYIHENEHDEVYSLPISSTIEWIFLW